MHDYLYAIAADFPGLAEAETLRGLPYRRVQALESAFAKDIADSRFVPFIQLHEYETYLFAEPTQFEYFYDGLDNQIKVLQDIADLYASPELINDGLQSAPSKRIIAQIPSYRYKKPIVGSQMAELIGLDKIRSKCPHFDQWITRLERLA